MVQHRGRQLLDWTLWVVFFDCIHEHIFICTNQQPPQRGGAVPDPVWVGSKWLLAFPRVPVTPGTPLHFFAMLPLNDLCFDWSDCLSSGVFLSIRSNVTPPSSQWIPTRLTSSPTFSYSAPAAVSIPLQLFLGSPSTALFSFLSIYLSWRPRFSHVSRPYAVSLLYHGRPSLFCTNLFFDLFSHMLHPDGFLS